MKNVKRTGPYEADGLIFWIQNCTIWYDSDDNGTVDSNVTWADFKANPNIKQTTKNAVEVQLDALGCPTP